MSRLECGCCGMKGHEAMDCGDACVHALLERNERLESQLALAREGLERIAVIENPWKGHPLQSICERLQEIAQQTLAALDGKAGEGR